MDIEPPIGGHSAGRPSLTERHKAATRLEIAEAAFTLFATQGVKDTTVAQIAEMAGVGTRTFHRHFTSKEEALAPMLGKVLDEFVTAFNARPLDEPLQQSLHAAKDQSTNTTRYRPDRLRHQYLLVISHPTLRPVWLEAHRHAEDQLGSAIAARTGQPAAAANVRITAGAVILALRITAELWAESPGARANTTTIFDECLESMAAGSGL